MAIRSKVAETANAPQILGGALPGAKQVVESTPTQFVGNNAPVVSDYKTAEAKKIRGQVRMHAILAAISSPAGPAFSPTAEAYLEWVKKAADLAVEYTFAEEK